MTSNATPSSLDAEMDQLVPPPGPAYRRVLLWVLFLALCAAVVWSTATGILSPKIENAQITSLGGDGPVQIQLLIQSGSIVDLQVVDGPEVPPGLKLLGYSIGDSATGEFRRTDVVRDPFPLTIRPDESLQLMAWYQVDDCNALGRDSEGKPDVDIRMKIASGPFSWVDHTRTVISFGGTDPQDDTAPWAYSVSQFTCGHEPG